MMAYRLAQSDTTAYGLALEHPHAPLPVWYCADAHTPKTRTSLHQLSIDQYDKHEEYTTLRKPPAVQILLELSFCTSTLRHVRDSTCRMTFAEPQIKLHRDVRYAIEEV